MIKLLTLFSFLCLASCGTDTGNPGQEPVNHDAGVVGIETPPEEIIPTFTHSICERINSCHEQSYESCNSSLFDLENIDLEIGVSEDLYKSLKEVHVAVSNEELIGDPIVFNKCLTEIEQLPCSSPEVQNAYIKGVSKEYEGVADMIPQSCEDLFKK